MAALVRYTLEDACRIATERGGECLSETYVNKRTPMRWRCARGHEWGARFQEIKRGTWCWECWKADRAGKHTVLKDGLDQARQIAIARAGQCLSEAYRTNATRMRWRCANGHEWEAAFADIKKGTWCPICSSGVRERVCRIALKHLTGEELPRARPVWLVNDLGNRMEFDGYNGHLRLAFEHQGEHHYRPLPHFQRRSETLQRRQHDDQTKRQLCVEQEITLIEIPYSIELSDLLNWLREQLEARRPDITLPDVSSDALIEYVSDDSLNELRSIARSRGGECLSPIFLGVEEKHQFRCAKGHTWWATASNVKARTWCPECKPDAIGSANRDPDGLRRMQRLAQERGGEFLSGTYLSVNHKCRWRCAQGHEWEAAPTDILKGTWCPSCSVAARRDTLEEMQRIARQRGGRCLSDKYVDQRTKVLWQCAQGHEWWAKPMHVKNSGSWCPVCANESRRTTKRAR